MLNVKFRNRSPFFLPPGTVVEVFDPFGYSHYLIVTSPKTRGPKGEDVIHNVKGRGVKWDFFKDAVAGRSWEVFNSPTSADEGNFRVRVAMRGIGVKYDLTEYNCEHFVTEVMTGKPRSHQMESVNALLSAVLTDILPAALMGMGAVAFLQSRRRPARRRR
jgi:hypothetical protein